MPGFEYSDTYAPVVDKTSVRIFLTISASLGLQMSQFDVKTAFLYGDLSEEIYMELPPGYKHYDRKKYVARLHKAIYGLKQAMTVWFLTFSVAIRSFGYFPMKSSPCLFLKRKDDDISLLSLYVDDGGFATSDSEEKGRLMSFLA